MNETRKKKEGSIRKGLRWILYPALSLLGLVVFVVVLLLIPQVRNLVLDRALDAARPKLPGELAIERAEWPGLGTLRFEGVRWTDGEATPIALDRLRVEVDLGALMGRNIRVRALEIEGVRADVPGFVALFPSGADDPEPIEEKTDEPPKPILGRIPALAVDTFRVTAPSIAVSDSLVLRDVLLTLMADNLDAGRPVLRIDELALRSENGPVVERGRFLLDLGKGRFEGESEGRIGPEFGYAFRAESTGERAFRIFLSENLGFTPPEHPGLALDVKFTEVRRGVIALEYDIELKTPDTADLARRPALSEKLAAVPDLEGILLRLAGDFRIDEEIALTARGGIDRNSWIEGADLAFSMDGAGLTVDTVSIRLPDLEAGIGGRLAGGEAEGRLDLRLRGARFARILDPELEPPDSLFADLTVDLAGPMRSPAVHAVLDAALRSGGLVVDRLALEADAPAFLDESVAVALDATAFDMDLAVRSELDLTDGIAAQVAPIRIVTSGSAAGSAPHREEWATVRYRPEGPALFVEDFRIEGDLGDLRIDGETPRDAGGFVDLSWVWAEPPAVLPVFGDVGADGLAAVREAWSAEGPFHLEARVETRPGSFMRIVRAASGFHLPGPRFAESFLPDADLEGMGPLDGTFVMTPRDSTTASGAEIELDLRSEGWLDSATVRGEVRPGRAEIDRFDIALEGISAEGSGVFGDGETEADAKLAVGNVDLLRRLLPGAVGSLAAALDLEFSYREKEGVRDLEAEFTASAEDASYSVPSLRGRAGMKGEAIELEIETPEGAEAGSLKLDRFTASYTGSGGDDPLFPCRIRVDAEGEGLKLSKDIHVERDSAVWSIRADEMSVEVAERDLRAMRPFTVRFDGGRKSVAVDDLNMEGGLGRLTAAGVLDSGASDITVDVDIDLPDRPEWITIPRGLWPSRVGIDLRARNADSLRLDAEVGGIDYCGRENLALRIGLRGAGDRIDIALTAADGGETLLSGEGSVPIDVDIWPPRGAAGDGEIRLDVEMTGFPVCADCFGKDCPNPEDQASLDGTLAIRGTPADPAALLDIRGIFPNWAELASYTLAVRAALQPENGLPPDLEERTGEALDRIRGGLPAGWEGVSGTVELERGEEPVVVGEGFYPMSLSILPTEITVGGDEPLRAAIEARDLALAEVARSLPADISVEGTGNLDLNVEGSGKDAAVDGTIRLDEVQVARADGSWISADAGIGASGTFSAPAAQGSVIVGSGVFQIPEAPPDLHEIEGDALLWKAFGDTFSTTVEIESVMTDTAALSAGDSGNGPDIDVILRIPGGLWIRGEQLEIELAGNLRIRWRGGEPVLMGDLEAVGGRLVLLGRFFMVERGRASFYGQDEIDPELDVVLAAQIGDSRIFVDVAGTGKKPQLTLRSDPEMDQGDIVSTIVLGKRVSELSDQQMSLLLLRAAEIAAVTGSARLSSGMTQHLGVDVFGIQQGSGPSSKESLIVGKYLSPRILLKYETALESSGGSLINVEYDLGRRLKIATIYGQQTQSGIELNWTIDY